MSQLQKINYKGHRLGLAEEINIFDLLTIRGALLHPFLLQFSQSRQQGSLRRSPLSETDLLNTIGTYELEEPLYLISCLCNSQESYLELLDFILSKCIYFYVDFEFCKVAGNKNECRIN